MSVPIIIPTYNPPNSFASFIAVLVRKKITPIIIMNDGCDSTYTPIFALFKKTKNITVCTHQKNMGKGQAMKTALRLIRKKFPSALGAVFADADGQHTPKDIRTIQRLLVANQTKIIIGKRALISMPLKNKLGNVLSSLAIRVFFHTNITDTQSGLRGVPKQFFDQLIHIQGNRYDYETGMLLWAVKLHIPIHEYSIQTIYTPYRSSHYRPVMDTLRIIRTLLRGVDTK